MEFHVVWRYRPAPGREVEFRKVYGSDGDWVRLFARAEGYRGSLLLEPQRGTGACLVIDRWASEAAYDAALATFAADYAALDHACAPLRTEESPLGRFVVR